MDASWAHHLFAAHRVGRLSGDELWCLVLACFEHERAEALAASVLRAYAPVPSEAEAVVDEFVLEEALSDAPAA